MLLRLRNLKNQGQPSMCRPATLIRKNKQMSHSVWFYIRLASWLHTRVCVCGLWLQIHLIVWMHPSLTNITSVHCQFTSAELTFMCPYGGPGYLWLSHDWQAWVKFPEQCEQIFFFSSPLLLKSKRQWGYLSCNPCSQITWVICLTMGNALSALSSAAFVSLPSQPLRQSPLPPIKKWLTQRHSSFKINPCLS